MRRLLATAALLLAAIGVTPCAAQGGAPASAPAAAVAAPNPENLAIARDIVDIMLPPEGRHAMMVRMSDTMFAQMRDVALQSFGTRSDPELQHILDRYLDRFQAVNNELSSDGAPAVFEAVARAYARMFSHDDLVQIRAFAATPAGMQYFRRGPDMLADPDVAEANRAYMTRTFAALQPLMEELRRDVEANMASRRPH